MSHFIRVVGEFHKSSAAATLADLHGTLGGTLREQGQLAEAINEYDRGYQIDKSYGFVSPNNALNRLLTRLLSVETPTINMGAELQKVKTLLADRVKDHPDDYWAVGDLALVAALLGDGPAMKKSLASFTTSSTPAFAYDAYIKLLSKLVGIQHPESRRLRTLLESLQRAKSVAPKPPR